jgi:hypothetical protein
MEPIFVPIVHAKLLGADAVSVRLGLTPLQVLAVELFVTSGIGFTVTVMFDAAPTQFVPVAVGVTIYTILPAVELLGFVRSWVIAGPAAAEAPLIVPVFVPRDHAKVLATLDVRVIPGLVPLQVLAVLELVTAGAGFTVTVIFKGAPTHELAVDVGVTIYTRLPAVVLLGLVNA